MTAHAYFAPSSSKRWMHCTKSPEMEAAAPDRETSYTDRGTKLHDLAYRILTYRILTRDNYDLDAVEEYSVELDTWDKVASQSVMDYVELVDSREGIKRFEIRTKWLPKCGGTSDCVVITPRKDGRHDLEVMDFKAGLGIREFAQENTQLMIYAFGVMDLYAAAFDFVNVTLTIAQTGVEDGVSSWRMTPAKVKKWRALIMAKVAQIERGETSFRPNPTHHICGWCDAKNECPGRNAVATDAARDDFSTALQAETKGGLSADAVGRDDLTWGQKLEIAAQLKAIAKDWEGEARRLLLTGEIEIEGKVVVEGSRKRDWTEEGKKAAKKLLESWEFDETDLYSEPTFATPSQADALVNADKETRAERKKELEGCYEWTPGAPAICDESKAGKKTILRKEDLARRDFKDHIETEEGPE